MSIENSELTNIRTHKAILDFGLEVTPNPTFGLLKMQLSSWHSVDQIRLSLHNSIGQRLDQKLYGPAQLGDIERNYSVEQKYPPGIYFLQIEADHQIWMAKIYFRLL